MFTEAGFTRFRRAAETPLNMIPKLGRELKPDRKQAVDRTPRT